MPPDEVDDINLIQFWKELNHIDVLTMKWNSCIDLRMNSVSHNSLLQGLRLLNGHMLQTTQLVINSLRELALYVHTNVWMENMSRSLWVAHIDLIPCQNQFGPRLCLPKCRGLWCIWIPPAVFACHPSHLPLASPPIHLHPLCHTYLSPYVTYWDEITNFPCSFPLKRMNRISVTFGWEWWDWLAMKSCLKMWV